MSPTARSPRRAWSKAKRADMAGLVVRRMTEARPRARARLGGGGGLESRPSRRGLFYAADPQGYFLAELDGASGRLDLRRCATARTFGFLGLYIVRPEFRGRGFGMALWRAAMDHFGDRIVGPRRRRRAAGRTTGSQASGSRTATFASGRRRRRRAAGSRRSRVVPFDEVARYDATVFPAPRDAFLASWIGQSQALALGVIDGKA